MGASSRRRLQLLFGVGVDHDDLRQGIVDVVVVILAPLEERVDWNRDGADSDRPEEGGHPARAVVANDEHTLLAPQAKVEEGAGGAGDQPGKIAVGQVAGGGVDRDLGGAAGLEVAFEQVDADVVPLR